MSNDWPSLAFQTPFKSELKTEESHPAPARSNLGTTAGREKRPSPVPNPVVCCGWTPGTHSKIQRNINEMRLPRTCTKCNPPGCRKTQHRCRLRCTRVCCCRRHISVDSITRVCYRRHGYFCAVSTAGRKTPASSFGPRPAQTTIRVAVARRLVGVDSDARVCAAARRHTGVDPNAHAQSNTAGAGVKTAASSLSTWKALPLSCTECNPPGCRKTFHRCRLRCTRLLLPTRLLKRSRTLLAENQQHPPLVSGWHCRGLAPSATRKAIATPLASVDSIARVYFPRHGF